LEFICNIWAAGAVSAVSAARAMSSDAAGEELRSCGTAPCVLARAASGLKVMGVVNRIGGEVNRIGGEVNRIGV